MYTHRIHFTKTPTVGACAGLKLRLTFPTTADALPIHVDGLQRNPEISEVRFEPIPAPIKGR